MNEESRELMRILAYLPLKGRAYSTAKHVIILSARRAFGETDNTVPSKPSLRGLDG